MIKIILAEDDEDDFLLFTEAIKDNKETLELTWVKDGEELMNRVGNFNFELPDLIFLDINMPRRNGFECLSDIRQDQRTKHIPVIIYSTSKDTALVSWMYNSGANLFLCKPTDFQQLKAVILRAIEMDWSNRKPYPPLEDFMLC